MSMPYYPEDIESDEDVESDEGFAEASRQRPPVRTARPLRMAPRPGGSGPVSRAEFTTTVAGLQADISRNSTAIRQVDGRVAAVGRDVARVRKDAADRRKDVANVKSGLAKTQELVVLLPLLTTALGSSNPQLAELLPFLLLGGFGGTGTDSGSSGGMFGGDMMMFVLLLVVLGH